MEKHQDSVYHTGKAQLFYNKDQVSAIFSSDYQAEPELKNEKVKSEDNLSLSSALTLINKKSSSITEEFYQDDTVTSKLPIRKKSDAHDFIGVCNADLEANKISCHDPDFCTYGCYECHEYNFERENEWTDAQPNAWDDWNKRDEPKNESKVSQLVLEPTVENIYKRPRLWTYNDVPEYDYVTSRCKKLSKSRSVIVERKGQKLARALSDYMVSSLKLEDM